MKYLVSLRLEKEAYPKRERGVASTEERNKRIYIYIKNLNTMKKIVVLCMAACGLMAAAQAQVKRVSPQSQQQNKRVLVKVENDIMPSGDNQVKSPVSYDTLLWHDEYTSEKCNKYIYYPIGWGMKTFGQIFTDDVVYSPFGATFGGIKGEVGATYTTEDNIYFQYMKLNLDSYYVVGAIGVVMRVGNEQAWAGKDLSRFDPEHITDYNGLKIPDLPYKMKGYHKVVRQDAVKNYWDATDDESNTTGTEYSTIEVEMPVSVEDATESPVDYIPFKGPKNTDDGPRPQFMRIGGLFEKAFSANKNFGLSVEFQWTQNATYDSLWNTMVGAKINSDDEGAVCTFVDEWSAWLRVNFTGHDSSWSLFWKSDGGDMNARNELDLNNDDWGLAPVGCPQEKGSDLFIYAFSYLRLADGVHEMPVIYPIIQDRASIESKDAYGMTVSVYPVPATDKVTIVAIDQIQKVEIYNMAGMLIRQVQEPAAKVEVDVTTMVPGSYIAKVITNKGVASKKLIVK